jgi:hypothetical protein
MPRGKKNGEDILSLLSADRRQAILDEALGARVRSILARHHRSSFGQLVEALRGDKRWDLLRTVSVGAVLRASAAGRGPGRPPGDGGPRRRGRRGRLDQATLDLILRYVEKHPGLRSEQIQAQLDVDRKLVKAGLAKLRELKKVRTSGHKRATTYTA